MYKIYGEKNPHDEFQGQWLSVDIDKHKKRIIGNNPEVCKMIKKYFTKNDKILEAGCGLAPYVIHFNHLGYKMDGVDFTEQVIQKLKEYDKNINIFYGDCMNLQNIPDNSYQGYVSLGVIEHNEDGPDSFIKEARRILVNGGIGLITVPYEDNRYFHKIYQPEEQAVLQKEGEFFEYGFKQSDIESYLEKYGFEVLEVFFHGFKPPLMQKKIFRSFLNPNNLNLLGLLMKRHRSKIQDKENAWMIGCIVRNRKD